MIRVLLIWIEGRGCIAGAWGRLGGGSRGFWVAFFEGCWGCHCNIFDITVCLGPGERIHVPARISIEIIS